MSKHPFVTVLIPTYKDTDALMLCLTALSRQDYPAQAFEVIVINNNPDAQIPPRADCPQLKILNEAQPGSYAARNTGLLHARGEILAFTDADCIPQPNWISKGVEVLVKHPQAFRVAGRVELYKVPGTSWAVWKYESTTSFNQKYNVSKGLSVTANLFVKKEAFSITGTFNDSLMSGGDMEWNKRASQKKLPIIFAPEAIVRHPARATMTELLHKYRRVSGGGLKRAQEENRVLSHLLRHFVPPVHYCYTLIKDDKPLVDVIFSGLLFWLIKMYMVTEALHLLMGKKPVR